ncbi:MAG: DNA polymerase III subunit delta [Oscillospiraceae bacterium]|nr:DNA polymerase III subunit delta [Oscillospiraceae bacterium]
MLEEAEVKRQIKEKDFARLYVVCGDEEYLKQYYAAQLCERAVEEAFRDFNFHRFEGKDTTPEEIAQAMEAFPLGGGRSCTMVRDFALEGMGGDAAFLAFLQGLPPHGVLVFWMDTAAFHPKKNKALLEAINAAGHVVQLNRPEAAQLARLVAAGAKKRGCAIGSGTVNYLIETVGGELNTLLNELEKLCAYAGEGQTVTNAHVDAVCVKSLDARSFDMVKAVAAGDGGRALRLLDELLRQKTAPPLLLGSLIANYVDIYRASAALRAKKRPEAMAQVFDYGGKTFRLQNAGRLAAKMPAAQILHCLALLDAADRKLKGSGLDPRFVLEECLAGLLVKT